MNPEQLPATEQTSEDHFTWRDGLRGIAYAMCGALVVNAALYGYAAAKSGQEERTLQDDMHEAAPSIAGYCDASYAEDPVPGNLYDTATGCVDYQQDADIALLYRAGNESAAANLATDVTRLLREQTHDILRVDIEPVLYDATLAATYDARYAAQGCAPSGDSHDWSARMALESKAMPELTSYDAVIGMTALPACENATLASSNADSGTVEIFGAHVTDSGVYGTETSNRPDRAVAATAHEIAHLFGMGHAGMMTHSRATLQEINGQVMGRSFGVLADDAPKDGPIDIVAWVSEGDYSEYGEQSLMGLTRNQDDMRPINNLQQYYLEWPYRALGQETAVRGISLDEEPAVFGADDTKPLVAHMSLGGYVSPPHDEGAEDFAKFTELVFATHDTDDDQLAVDVYVAHPLSRDVAMLGTIWAYDTKRFELYGGQDARVIVDVDMAQNTVSFTKRS